ncbi:MAG: RraA family protein [Pseudomonadota bacterium]
MAHMPSPEEIIALRKLGAATLYEAQGSGALNPAIKPLRTATRMAGPALTVRVPPGDNLALHYAITRARADQILVVDYGAHLDVAVTGDVMVAGCQARGVAGMVVDGAVRDADEIAAMGFAMFARGLSIVGPKKEQGGSVGEPITCGGVRIESGDIIVGDSDGVVAIAKDAWPEVLAAAQAREAREANVKSALAQGETTVALMGLEGKLRDVGLV